MTHNSSNTIQMMIEATPNESIRQADRPLKAICANCVLHLVLSCLNIKKLEVFTLLGFDPFLNRTPAVAFGGFRGNKLFPDHHAKQKHPQETLARKIKETTNITGQKG